jgi:hypothetical protein
MLHPGPARYTLRNKATQQEEREECEVLGVPDNLCQMRVRQGAQPGPNIAPMDLDRDRGRALLAVATCAARERHIARDLSS